MGRVRAYVCACVCMCVLGKKRKKGILRRGDSTSNDMALCKMLQEMRGCLNPKSQAGSYKERGQKDHILETFICHVKGLRFSSCSKCRGSDGQVLSEGEL